MSKRGKIIQKNEEKCLKKYRYDTENNQYTSVYVRSCDDEVAQSSVCDDQCTINPKDSYTFREVVAQWKTESDINRKGATRAKYSFLIEKHINPELGHLPISDISNSHINDFTRKKLSSGSISGDGLSSAYVRTMIIIIDSVIQYAANEGLCSPLKKKICKPGILKKELVILSQYEQEILSNYLTEDMDQTKLGVLISLSCGLRIGEVCALKWEDIDVERRIINIRHTVARIQTIDGGTAIVLDSPKTQASIRKVPIHSQLIPYILSCKKISSSPYVISETDSFVSTRTFEYRYHRILDRCGIKAYNYHVLRHTFATRCIMAGVDIKTLSEILGHSNVSITLNTYVHITMEMKLQQIEKLSFC